MSPTMTSRIFGTLLHTFGTFFLDLVLSGPNLKKKLNKNMKSEGNQVKSKKNVLDYGVDFATKLADNFQVKKESLLLVYCATYEL